MKAIKNWLFKDELKRLEELEKQYNDLYYRTNHLAALIAEKELDLEHSLQYVMNAIEEEKGDESDYATPESIKLVKHWNNCIDVIKQIIQSYIDDK